MTGKPLIRVNKRPPGRQNRRAMRAIIPIGYRTCDDASEHMVQIPFSVCLSMYHGQCVMAECGGKLVGTMGTLDSLLGGAFASVRDLRRGIHRSIKPSNNRSANTFTRTKKVVIILGGVSN